MSELIYKKVNEVFRHTDDHYYKCVEGLGCHNCAFGGTSYCGLYACGDTDRRDRVPVEFVAVSDESIESMKEKDAVEPSRHIELSVLRVEGDKVTFKIIEQTHRQEKFSLQKFSTFRAANGFELASANYPYMTDSDTLFCRGNIRDRDDDVLICTSAKFAQISEAVFEYNATNGRGYEKPCLQLGDRYFYITAYGTVASYKFDGGAWDSSMQSFGNVFRTEQEALAARNKIEILLKALNSAERTGANEL